MKDSSASHDLPHGNPSNDPGVRKIIGDIAEATHSEEEAVLALFSDAYEALYRDARIFGFVPLLAAKRVRKMLQERVH